jgi:cell filamentation protein
MYDAVDDPYTYENSTVLINKLDLRDQGELDDFEAEITTARAGRTSSGRQSRFCALLCDPPSFIPGSVRLGRHSANGKKHESAFCFPEHIEAQATKLFSDLKAKKYLQNLPANEFAAKAAHFLSELNAIHAFREGNGRTQLTFFALLADRAGQALELEKLNPDAMLRAMIASFDGDVSELVRVIRGLIR